MYFSVEDDCLRNKNNYIYMSNPRPNISSHDIRFYNEEGPYKNTLNYEEDGIRSSPSIENDYDFEKDGISSSHYIEND